MCITLEKEDVMEFGLIPQLDEFSFNSQQETQIVNASKESREVLEQPDIKEVIKEKFQKGLDETSKLQQSSNTPTYSEFVLTNLNFGFNNESRDFFVKAIRGDIENQYPTDEMMRLKAYLMQQNQVAS